MPLDLQVQKIATTIFTRIQNQMSLSWDGIGCKLGKLGHLKTCLKTAEKLGIVGVPNDKIVECKNWELGFRILDFADHKHDASEMYSKLYCYTDGSKINDGSGCGFQIRKGSTPQINYHEHLGKHATVFQSEVVALSRAAKHLSIRNNQDIIFRVDSQSAIRSICKNSISSALVKECVENLNDLSKRNKVTIQWIKAHFGHEGNEAADANAKIGAQKQVQGMEPFLPVPVSFNKKEIDSTE